MKSTGDAQRRLALGFVVAVVLGVLFSVLVYRTFPPQSITLSPIVLMDWPSLSDVDAAVNVYSAAAKPIRPDRPFFDFDNLLRQTASGQLAFNSPTEMNIDETRPIVLLLSRHKTQDELKKEISSEIRTDENIQGAGVKISPKMEAHLTGEAFNIVAVAPEVQALDPRENEWKWDIRPKREGLHPLHIALSIMVDGTPHFEHSFDRTIKVRVTAPQRVGSFLSHHWEWLGGFVFIPVAILIWKWRKKKKEAQKDVVNPDLYRPS